MDSQTPSTWVERVGQMLLAVPFGLAGGFLLGGLIMITANIPHLPDLAGALGFGGVPGAILGATLFPVCYAAFLIRIPVIDVVIPIGIGTYIGAVFGILVSVVCGALVLYAALFGGALGCVVTSVILCVRISVQRQTLPPP